MFLFVILLRYPSLKVTAAQCLKKIVWVKVADLEGKLTKATKAKGLCITMKHNLYTPLVASLS